MTILIYICYNNINYLKMSENNVFSRNITKSRKQQEIKQVGQGYNDITLINY
jgi:hypothetical protein